MDAYTGELSELAFRQGGTMKSTRWSLLGSLLVAAGCLAMTILSAAQGLNAKTGLWEVISSTQSSPRSQMDMSSLTPDQRKRMEAAMNRPDLSTPKTSRECMTKARIDKMMFLDDKMSQSCTRTSISDTPSLQEFKVECAGYANMSGTMRFQAMDPENVTGTIKMSTAGGGGQTMNTTFKAKWISANCGDVK
jgi:hypothetical protein